MCCSFRACKVHLANTTHGWDQKDPVQPMHASARIALLGLTSELAGFLSMKLSCLSIDSAMHCSFGACNVCLGQGRGGGRGRGTAIQDYARPLSHNAAPSTTKDYCRTVSLKYGVSHKYPVSLSVISTFGSPGIPYNMYNLSTRSVLGRTTCALGRIPYNMIQLIYM